MISKAGLAKRLEVSQGTIDGWMKRHLTRGWHYTVVGRQAMFDAKRVEEWLRSGLQASGPAARESGLPSGDMGGRPMTRPSRVSELLSHTIKLEK